jgi:hypothetical protein
MPGRWLSIEVNDALEIAGCAYAGSLADALGGEPAQDDFEAWLDRLTTLRILGRPLIIASNGIAVKIE